MAKSPRPPTNIPNVGDRVKLRGRKSIGLLEGVNDRQWAIVAWDAELPGPKIVHLFELEKLPEHG